ncbi:epoxide hydrolase [Ceratobasidium sp. AG-Ba]|nr:epoxide hydrolase [Ceratobasidium sp. AG-Ba]
MASSDDIRPFRISVSDEQLHELRAKLEIARLPDELDLPESQQWDWGIPLSVVKSALEHWRTTYDWRAVEARLNDTLPQFITHIDSLEHGPQEVHFVHKRSKNPNATPLIFVHGWPGNFLEVSKMIDQLADPTDPNAPAFHVVAPSLPGYVFSQRASTPGMDVKASAFVFDKLMAKLGYNKYLAQGGDWGSLVCRSFAVYHQGTCIGTHLNMAFSGGPSFLKNPLIGLRAALGLSGLPGGLSADEVKALNEAKVWSKTGRAYFDQQSTRPQTLAVGLTDSPVGLLAWIGEKLYAWTDSYPWTPEEMITWTMLYWINGPAGGLRFYKENALYLRGDTGTQLRTSWTSTPLGFSMFPKEIYRPPIEWLGTNQSLYYAKKHDKGGHFAAWEVPDLLAEDIRKFASIVLSKDARPLNTTPYTTLLVGISTIVAAVLVLPRVAPRLLGKS